MKVAIVVIVIALLGVGGFVFMNSQKSKSAPDAMLQQSSKSTSGNVISSIKDALSKSMSLKCDYKDDRGMQYTTYIKAGSVRVETVADTKDTSQMGNIIMKDKKMYMWNDTTKTGFSYTVEIPTGMPTTTKISVPPTNDKANQQATLMAQMEKYKDSCKAATVSDSMFTPPTDVKFQDYTEMMNGLKQKAASITPGQGSSADYQKTVQEMMKRLSPTQ